MNITAWQIFEKSGRVSDYLAFKTDDTKSSEMVTSAEAYNADKNCGDCGETKKCRRKRPNNNNPFKGPRAY